MAWTASSIYSVFVFIILIFPYFRFCAMRYIKLAISSAFERTLIYRIMSCRIVFNQQSPTHSTDPIPSRQHHPFCIYHGIPEGKVLLPLH